MVWLRRLAGIALLALAAGGALFAYAFLVELGWLETTSTEVPVNCARSPLRIAALADLHVGPLVDADRVRAAVALANAAQPDVIVLVGDHVSVANPETAAVLARELAELYAPEGVYEVLGNHDYWTDAATVRTALRRAGVQELSNAAVPLGAGLYLAGVDNVWEQHADLGRALAPVPVDGCVVLLAHEPDFADDAARDSRVGLQISGHSHGGQVRFPGLPWVLPPYAVKYPLGLERVPNGPWVYTSRGVGLVEPAARFGSRPEVSVITVVPVATSPLGVRAFPLTTKWRGGPRG